MKSSHVRIHRALLAVTACGTLLLGLTGCEPKPKHEIGKVEYDKLVDWKELVELGPKGCRKFLGQTVTFKGMYHSGVRQEDEQRRDVCLCSFSPYDFMLGPYADSMNSGNPSLGVYVNLGSEVTEWLPTAATDTFLTSFRTDDVVKITDSICKNCLGRTKYDHLKKEYFGAQSEDECFLESKALHITGRVVGIDYVEPNVSLITVPTGISW